MTGIFRGAGELRAWDDLRKSPTVPAEMGQHEGSAHHGWSSSMKVKQLVTYAAIAFVVFYLFTQPEGAANAVRGVMDGIGTGANSLAQFFNSLFTGS
ncbi:hypothetical protein GCM10009555_027140 [Acrocarpospora macrocephala]|uniref:Uncharacterized protein n=1 Tax=Acrocarpospora macrocephala TaxID=150177 RepID=A0A5M3WRW3_9ACTN|nr:hypothetical protein Amac_044260 [Acrocarpospora macrocephala]